MYSDTEGVPFIIQNHKEALRERKRRWLGRGRGRQLSGGAGNMAAVGERKRAMKRRREVEGARRRGRVRAEVSGEDRIINKINK
jgi:hypothetical protein